MFIAVTLAMWPEFLSDPQNCWRTAEMSTDGWQIIRSGANAFNEIEIKTISIVFVIIALL